MIINNYLKFILFLLPIFLISCVSSKEIKCEKNINNMLDYYISVNNINDKEILLKYDIVPWEKRYFLITITSINKDVYYSLGKEDISLGRYFYKNNSISVFSSNTMKIDFSLNDFLKYSNKSYSNKTGMIINYDPNMLSFFVNKKNLCYVKIASEYKND